MPLPLYLVTLAASQMPSPPSYEKLYPPPSEKDGRIALVVQCKGLDGEEMVYGCELAETSADLGANPERRVEWVGTTTAKMLLESKKEDRRDCKSSDFGPEELSEHSTERQKQLFRAIKDSAVAACNSPDEAHIRTFVSALFDARSSTCMLSRHRMHVNLKYSAQAKAWVGSTEPYGECGTVDTYRLERDNSFWNAKLTRVLTTMDSTDCALSANSSKEVRNLHWTWQSRGFSVPEFCASWEYSEDPPP